MIKTEYATELKMHLKEVYQRVAQNLGFNRKEMQKPYNKNIRFHDYHVGEKVWLQTKYFKTGQNRKLSPRRNGPCTVIDKLPNGLNLRIENDSTGNRQVVHHNRLTPSKAHASQDSVHENNNTPYSLAKPQSISGGKCPAQMEGRRQVEDESCSSESESEDNALMQNRRYPLRQRR